IWKMEVISKKQLEQTVNADSKNDSNWLETVKEGNPFTTDSAYKQEIISTLDWKYKHPLATQRMSKQSVTEIKRMFELSHDETTGTQLMRRTSKLDFERPKFMQEQSILSP